MGRRVCQSNETLQQQQRSKCMWLKEKSCWSSTERRKEVSCHLGWSKKCFKEEIIRCGLLKSKLAKLNFCVLFSLWFFWRLPHDHKFVHMISVKIFLVIDPGLTLRLGGEYVTDETLGRADESRNGFPVYLSGVEFKRTSIFPFQLSSSFLYFAWLQRNLSLRQCEVIDLGGNGNNSDKFSKSRNHTITDTSCIVEPGTDKSAFRWHK